MDISYSITGLAAYNVLLAGLIRYHHLEDEIVSFILGGVIAGTLSTISGLCDQMIALDDTNDEQAEEAVRAGLMIYFSALEINWLANSDFRLSFVFLFVAAVAGCLQEPEVASFQF